MNTNALYSALARWSKNHNISLLDSRGRAIFVAVLLSVSGIFQVMAQEQKVFYYWLCEIKLDTIADQMTSWVWSWCSSKAKKCQFLLYT